MPGEVNCIFTKVLIPFLEREVGPEAGALFAAPPAARAIS